MREVLFRGKRIDNGEWVYGDLLQVPKNNKYSIMPQNPVAENYAVEKETIGQYTGLKDKNGNKIFDGDIVVSDNGERKGIFVIRYGEFIPKTFYDTFKAYFGWKPKEKIYGLYGESVRKSGDSLLTSDMRFATVLGNIHDNPEILEET